MSNPLTIPYEAVMLFNGVKLKPGAASTTPKWRSAICATSSSTPTATTTADFSAPGCLNTRDSLPTRTPSTLGASPSITSPSPLTGTRSSSMKNRTPTAPSGKNSPRYRLILTNSRLQHALAGRARRLAQAAIRSRVYRHGRISRTASAPRSASIPMRNRDRT